MLKGPVKQLLTQRSWLKTKRVEARRTRASGQVVCVAARELLMFLPWESEADRPGSRHPRKSAGKTVGSVHVGEVCFCFFEWSPSFSFYSVKELKKKNCFWSPPNHLVYWASRCQALLGASMFLRSHFFSSSSLSFALDGILPSFKVQAPVPPASKPSRRFCHVDLGQSHRWVS